MSGDDEDEDEGEASTLVTATASVKRACERTETSVRDGWKLPLGLQCSRLKVATATKCFSALTLSFFALPMERFITRRAGPPTSAWPQRHAEEDFLALVRHNAAAQLEMQRWPPVLKNRRVEKPTMDEQ